MYSPRVVPTHLSTSFISPSANHHPRNLVIEAPTIKIAHRPSLNMPVSPTSQPFLVKNERKEHQPRLSYHEDRSVKVSEDKNLSISFEENKNNYEEHSRLLKDIARDFKGLESKVERVNARVQDVCKKIEENQFKMEILVKSLEEKTQKYGNLQRIVESQVKKKINENQQHLIFQSKLIKAEMDTIKLQLMDPPKNKLNLRFQQNLSKMETLMEQKFATLKKQLNSHNPPSNFHNFREKIHSLIKLRYEISCGENPEKMEKVEESQIFYGLDEDGFLTDGDGKYLVDFNGEKIRLEGVHIEKLKSHQMMEN